MAGGTTGTHDLVWTIRALTSSGSASSFHLDMGKVCALGVACVKQTLYATVDVQCCTHNKLSIQIPNRRDPKP